MPLKTQHLSYRSKPILATYHIYHCVKSVQIRSYFWSVFSCIRTEYGSPNTEKYGPEITPYLDTFHAVYGFDIQIQ